MVAPPRKSLDFLYAMLCFVQNAAALRAFRCFNAALSAAVPRVCVGRQRVHYLHRNFKHLRF